MMAREGRPQGGGADPKGAATRLLPSFLFL